MVPVNSFSLLYHLQTLSMEESDWKSFTSNLIFDMELNLNGSLLLLDFINICYSYPGN